MMSTLNDIAQKTNGGMITMTTTEISKAVNVLRVK